MKHEAIKLIKKYHKASGTNAQRAELLARNAAFTNELGRLLETFQLKHLLPAKHVLLKSRKKGRISVTKVSKERVEIIGPHLSSPKALEMKKDLKETLEISLKLWTNFCAERGVMPVSSGA